MSWECVYRTPTAEGDHCKYATDYAKQGIACYGNQDIADKKKFPFGFIPYCTGKITVYVCNNVDAVCFDFIK